MPRSMRSSRMLRPTLSLHSFHWATRSGLFWLGRVGTLSGNRRPLLLSALLVGVSAAWPRACAGVGCFPIRARPHCANAAYATAGEAAHGAVTAAKWTSRMPY
jgi:hypothetical protein